MKISMGSDDDLRGSLLICCGLCLIEFHQCLVQVEDSANGDACSLSAKDISTCISAFIDSFTTQLATKSVVK
jgi:hypothetical protein